MIQTVLFDLDGTLLPMDNKEFTKAYFTLLTKKLALHGYEPEKLISVIWKGTAAMVKNDSTKSNESAFWQCFAAEYGQAALQDKPLFDEFYQNEFQKAKSVCGFTPKAAEAVALAKQKGWVVALATNPIFPAVATESRIRWAGLNPEDFALYTTYENIGSCKPNLHYYRAILHRLNADPAQTLMVGNDVGEDMVAAKLGMDTFLLTDYMINQQGDDISALPQGNFDALLSYLKAL